MAESLISLKDKTKIVELFSINYNREVNGLFTSKDKPIRPQYVDWKVQT